MRGHGGAVDAETDRNSERNTPPDSAAGNGGVLLEDQARPRGEIHNRERVPDVRQPWGGACVRDAVVGVPGADQDSGRRRRRLRTGGEDVGGAAGFVGLFAGVD